MGLDTTHDAWSGPYTAFHRWRKWIAKQVGIPLDLMEGFYSWEWDSDEPPNMEQFSKLYELSGNCNCYYDTLKAMRDFGKPLPWTLDSPIIILLRHSDCDGEIKWQDCFDIAECLSEVIDSVDDDFEKPVYSADHPQSGHYIWETWDSPRARACYDGMVPATKRFIKGLEEAFNSKENLGFH